MKLTREQVAQLSEIELNRAMVWCYPDKRNYDGYYDEYMGYDYLTDYNLTMPLAYENELCIELYKKRPDSSNKCWVYNINDTVRSLSYNPLRAICEVLLMIAMEREA